MFRILIADDHDIVRAGLKQLLQEEFPALSIEEVNDTASLIETACSHHWDIIISDASMPGGGGFYALEKIKNEKPHVPVIMISSQASEYYTEKAIKAGAERFVSKDFLSTELVKTVKDILERK
jgi:two-component system, NarL family, invasion response regulator UvrY